MIHVVPALRRDPYAVVAFGTGADAFRKYQRQGLWVPAQGQDDAELDGIAPN